jgi:hypothetical protein
MNQLQEVYLYYAAEINQEDIIIGEYIFETVDHANASGLIYSVATWINLKEAVSRGEIFPNRVVCTPQGRFVWQVFFNDNDEEELNTPYKCVYRAVGAPEAFSEAIEYHLFWNEGAELIRIVKESGVYKAIIKNQNGGMVVIKS